jgi:hypothetical protein
MCQGFKNQITPENHKNKKKTVSFLYEFHFLNLVQIEIELIG